MKLKLIVPVLLLTGAVAGCVVAPAGRGYRAPEGVVYVAPAYVQPRPGLRMAVSRALRVGLAPPAVRLAPGMALTAGLG